MNKYVVPAAGKIMFGLLGALSAVSLAAADTSALNSRLVLGIDASGIMGTYKADGPLNKSSAFFRSLGTNGRSCGTCHIASQAMSFTPAHALQLYEQTHGSDPLFAATDGANCTGVAPKDRAGHSLLLKSGLIRIATPVPAGAEFSISVVHDPYGCALRVDPNTQVLTASVYRRPLPAANLSFLSAVMFDGRETIAPLTDAATFDANLRADLTHQALDATMGHAQASKAPTDAQLSAIVDFELGVYSGQLWDNRSGMLTDDGAAGGPMNLAAQLYYPGINDTLGGDPNGIPFTPLSMTLYASWQPAANSRRADDRFGNFFGDFRRSAARADIAAGEKLFTSAPMTISNVRGLNDNAALKNPTAFAGTCATCHDAPNVGNHSLPLPLDIGVSHSSNLNYETDLNIAAAVRELSGPDLPVFIISGCANPFNKGQKASFYTSDPGKALISGHCADFNRVKGPILRGLAARAPYFHNGAAADLNELVNFYNQRFQMALSEKQKGELVAFLNSL
jgi:cytochrome c peroxidase